MTQKIKCKEMKKSGGKKKNDKRNPRREKEKKEILKKIMSIYTREKWILWHAEDAEDEEN